MIAFLAMSAALMLQAEAIRCEIEYSGTPPDPTSAQLACPDGIATEARLAAQAAFAGMDVVAPNLAGGLRRALFLFQDEGQWRVRRWPTILAEPATPYVLAMEGFTAICLSEGAALPDGRMTDVTARCATAHDSEPWGDQIRELYELVAAHGFAQWRYSPSPVETRQSTCFQFQVSGGESLELVSGPPC